MRALDRNAMIFLTVGILLASVVVSCLLVFGVFNLATGGNGQVAYETGSYGLNFVLDSQNSVSVPQRGSTNILFRVWLDSSITKETDVNLHCDRLDCDGHSTNWYNLDIEPSSFNLQPGQSKTCVLTISAGDQTPAGKYQVDILAPVGNSTAIPVIDGIHPGKWEILGYLDVHFVVTHAVLPDEASIDCWLDPTQTCSSSGDSYLTVHCKNWGGTDGTFNLTSSFGNAAISGKNIQPYSLLNSSAVVFPMALFAGEQKDINVHFTTNGTADFNITLSLNSNQGNLHVEPLYVCHSLSRLLCEYRSLDYSFSNYDDAFVSTLNFLI